MASLIVPTLSYSSTVYRLYFSRISLKHPSPCPPPRVSLELSGGRSKAKTEHLRSLERQRKEKETRDVSDHALPNATDVGVGRRRSPEGALQFLRLVPAGGDAMAAIIDNQTFTALGPDLRFRFLVQRVLLSCFRYHRSPRNIDRTQRQKHVVDKQCITSIWDTVAF